MIFGVEDDRTVTGHAYPAHVINQMLAVLQARLVPPQMVGYCVVLDGFELLVFEVESAPRAVMVQGDGFPYRISDTTPACSLSLASCAIRARASHACSKKWRSRSFRCRPCTSSPGDFAWGSSKSRYSGQMIPRGRKLFARSRSRSRRNARW